MIDRLGFALVLVSLAMLLASGCSSTPPVYRLGPHIGYFDVNGDVTAVGERNNLTVKGTTTADEMGFGWEFGWSPRQEVVWPDWILGLSGIYVDYSGDGTAEVDMQIGNRPGIERGEDIHSEATIWFAAVDGLYRILTPDDFMEFGLGLGLGAASLDLKLQGQGLLRAELSYDELLPFGYLAAMIGKDFGPVRVQVTGQGISVHLSGSSSDTDVDYWELNGLVTVDLWGQEGQTQGELALGYRYLSVDYTEDYNPGQLRADINIKGPYLGLIIVF